MDSELSPGRAIAIGALVFLTVCAIIAAVIGGGYELGWFFQNNSAQREAHLIQNGFNFQSTLGQQITKGIDSVTQDSTEIKSAELQNMGSYANSLKAQRENDANTVCQQATEITGSISTGAYQGRWIRVNCQGGSVSPSSVYYYVGG
jgi:hypothetical protein